MTPIMPWEYEYELPCYDPVPMTIITQFQPFSLIGITEKSWLRPQGGQSSFVMLLEASEQLAAKVHWETHRFSGGHITLSRI